MIFNQMDNFITWLIIWLTRWDDKDRHPHPLKSLEAIDTKYAAWLNSVKSRGHNNQLVCVGQRC